MRLTNINDTNRAFASVFSGPVYKSIFEKGDNNYLLELLSKYRSAAGIRKGSTVKKAIEKSYDYLLGTYRSEYVYKNTIANQLLDRHDLQQTTMINEFKIASSIADLVMINGVNTIYEIKTELDSPSKLLKQLADYRKVSPKIFLVTHHNIAEKYLQHINESSVGVIILNTNGNHSIEREATLDYSSLSSCTMMQTLRKDEYCSILRTFYGVIPDVPSIHFYKECLNWSEKIQPAVFHELMLVELRKRRIKEASMLFSSKTPTELKHICIHHNPASVEYDNLHQFLELTI